MQKNIPFALLFSSLSHMYTSQNLCYLQTETLSKRCSVYGAFQSPLLHKQTKKIQTIVSKLIQMKELLA